MTLSEPGAAGYCGSRLTGAGKLVSSFDWRGLYERYCTTPPEPETRPEPEEA